MGDKTLVYRPWGRADLCRLQDLQSRDAAFALHSIELPYRLALAMCSDLGDTLLCEAAGGALLGGAMVGSWQMLDLIVSAAGVSAGVHNRLLGWALARWALGPGQAGRHLWASAHEADPLRRAMLAEGGFALDQWYLQHLTRCLADDLRQPVVPAGYVIRPLEAEREVPAVASLHRESFGSELMTEAWRKEVLQAPGYRPDLDLVAVGPESELAAYCLFWVQGREAQIEPLATSPGHRRKGLARALMFEGFRRLRAAGVHRVHVEHFSGSPEAAAAYADAGFRPSHRVLQYVARYPRTAGSRSPECEDSATNARDAGWSSQETRSGVG